MTRQLYIFILIACLWNAPAFAQRINAIDTAQERSRIEAEIQSAEKLSTGLGDGLIKGMILMRIEVLRLSLALIDQRRIGTGLDAKAEVVVPHSQPDPVREAQIDRELRIIDGKIAKSQQEAQKSGGLMRGLAENHVAVLQLQYEMLQLELLKARYGIAWMPKSPPAPVPSVSTPPPSRPLSAPPAAAGSDARQQSPRATILVPVVSGKRFRPSDWQSRVYEDAIWFDISWNTAALPRPTRAIKGVLVFADLFGEPQFLINWTIDNKLLPGKAYGEKGVGFKYNQFMDSHKWMKNTELPNMKIWLEVRDIIFEDGSRETLE